MKSIIPKIEENENQLYTSVDRFFKEIGFRSLLKQCNITKEKGVPCLQVFKWLFLLVFTGKNLYRTTQSQLQSMSFAKDVVYRFLNSVHFNWHKLLLLLSSTVINTRLLCLTSEDRVNVLVVDDSFYGRERSKKVELLAQVKDHADKGQYKKGFRMLTLGWSDGNTFIPLLFHLLSSPKSKNRLCGMKENIDKRTNGFKRRLNALKSAPDLVIDMLKEAKENHIPADYVLFDSWFAFPKTLRSIHTLGFHSIAMIKNTPKIHYQWKGKSQKLSSINAQVRKKRGKAKILASAIVGIGQNSDGHQVIAKIVFVRDRHRKGQWLALISTDIELADEEIVRIYGKRWDIEVFSKTCKSYLCLAKEFQGRSYDMMVAHTAIVFTRYIMLALEKRKQSNWRTVGELFFYCCEELQDIQFVEALNLIISIIKQALKEKILLSKEVIDDFVTYFINALPAFLKEKLYLLSCES